MGIPLQKQIKISSVISDSHGLRLVRCLTCSWGHVYTFTFDYVRVNNFHAITARRNDGAVMSNAERVMLEHRSEGIKSAIDWL